MSFALGFAALGGAALGAGAIMALVDRDDKGCVSFEAVYMLVYGLALLACSVLLAVSA